MFNLNLNSAPRWLMGAVAVAIVLQALSGLLGVVLGGTLPSPISPEQCVVACGGHVANFHPRRCVCQGNEEEPASASVEAAHYQRRMM